MENLLPKFRLKDAPALALDDWNSAAAVPQHDASRARADDAKPSQRPFFPPNQNTVPVQIPNRKCQSISARVKKFEDRVDAFGVGHYSQWNPSPLSTVARGASTEPEAVPAVFTGLTRARENGSSNARTLCASSSKPKGVVAATRKDGSDAVGIQFQNHSKVRDAEVYFTSGKGIKSFCIEPGGSNTQTHGSALPDTPDDGIKLHFSPLDSTAWGSDDGPFKSLDDVHPVTIQFCNHDNACNYEILWVDYDGQLVLRRCIRPGEGYMERSFSTHPWLIREASGDKRSMILSIGDQAASVNSRFHVVWNPFDQSMSFMSQASAKAGELKKSVIEAQPLHSSARLNQGRALLIQQMRELRRDPMTNMEPNVTCLIMPRQSGFTR
jgi:hypothetical protein